MMDLFGLNNSDSHAPLAARMRPILLDEYIGQQHLLEVGQPFRTMLEQGSAHSFILWGPPGVGKTTLAEIYGRMLQAHVEKISAVTAGIKDIRQAIQLAKQNRPHKKTVLFVDEVHRFNKGQQDAFLPYIEDGTIIFIGATTENPGFALNKAILSRARVYHLHPLYKEDILQLIEHALTSPQGYGDKQISLTKPAKEMLALHVDGDARQTLNILELAIESAQQGKSEQPLLIDEVALKTVLGVKQHAIDKNSDDYYDLLSAFHKSVRGSSPDGALYWYCRFLAAGGDPLVIARRLLAIASEDIGNADPRALEIAVNAWDIFERVGPAEGERAIAQATIFCACAAKSNAVYTAFNHVKALVAKQPNYSVPLHLRNAPTAVHSDEGYGKEYQYAHHYPDAFVPGESYVPPEFEKERWYQPVERGLEKKIKEKLQHLEIQHQNSDWKRYR